MTGAQTVGNSPKVVTTEAWENLGPAGVFRVTMLVMTASLLLQVDGTGALASNGPLGNRRRARLISATVPGTTALQANVGFDNTVSATVGWPLFNNGVPLELLADKGVPIWIFAIVAGTFVFMEEATG